LHFLSVKICISSLEKATTIQINEFHSLSPAYRRILYNIIYENTQKNLSLSLDRTHNIAVVLTPTNNWWSTIRMKFHDQHTISSLIFTPTVIPHPVRIRSKFLGNKLLEGCGIPSILNVIFGSGAFKVFGTDFYPSFA